MPKPKEQPDDPILVAGYNDGLSFATIGAMVDRSADAVRVRLNELRKRGLVGYRDDRRGIGETMRARAVERIVPALSDFRAVA